MPTLTFRNLPPAKRHQLTVALKTEFAQHDYHGASVDRITQMAGISKGSFYQYFRNKEDAYAFAVEDSLQQRLAMTDALGPEATFAQRLTSIVRDTQSFQQTDPLSWGVLMRWNDSDSPDTGFGPGHLSYEWVRDVIRDGIAGGELHPDLDPDVAAWFVEHTITGLGRYLTARVQAPGVGQRWQGVEVEQEQAQQIATAVLDMMLRCLTARSD